FERRQIFRADVVVRLAAFFNGERLVADSDDGDELQGVTQVAGVVINEQLCLAMSFRRSKEFWEREPQARACTRIRSDSGAVPRRLRLKVFWCLPSSSSTKVRKKPSGGVRFRAFRASRVRKRWLLEAFSDTRVFSCSAKSFWPYMPSRSKKMLLLSRVWALGLSIHSVKYFFQT